MNLREISENNELDRLNSNAQMSKNTKGRKVTETECEIRTCYQRDRDRIVHSKAFRRLMHKTQVFISPDGDHFRTRLFHTLEVSQISRTIAKALSLNEELTEAIALGHDLGHTPFGHMGEDALARVSGIKFEHNIQSARVVQKLENGGKGLNLCYETLDGIINHRGAGSPKTLEGKIVQIADKIAYVNHDIDDAIRGGIISQNDLPSDLLNKVGQNSSQRISYFVSDIVNHCNGKAILEQSTGGRTELYELREFMFKNVYKASKLREDEEKVYFIFDGLFNYFYKHFDKIPQEYKAFVNTSKKEKIICDYLSGMTDRYALNIYKEIFLPKNFKI